MGCPGARPLSRPPRGTPTLARGGGTTTGANGLSMGGRGGTTAAAAGASGTVSGSGSDVSGSKPLSCHPLRRFPGATARVTGAPEIKKIKEIKKNTPNIKKNKI